MSEAIGTEASNRSYHEAQDRMAMLPNYYRWIARQFRAYAKGTVVELGVGAGFVMQHYLSRVDHVIGVDFNPVLLERLKERFPERAVSVCELDLRSEWDDLGSGVAETVVALDVLEHFEDDRDFMRKLHGVLRPGGVALIKVPAQPQLFSEMDKASGHFRRYAPDTLRKLMEESGFRTERLKYMNVVGALAYRRKRNRATNFSRSVSHWQLKFADTAMPLISACDVLPLKGLSIVGVFSKVA